VTVPLNTTVAPSGTLRVILRAGRAEVHYQVDGSALKSSARPHGDRTLGVDKGYTEVLTDSDAVHHGPGLGRLLSAESDRLKVKNRRRAKIRAAAKRAAARGDQAKADRITRCNLGTAKKARARHRFEGRARTVTFEAVHAVIDKAATIVAEDLTKPFAGRNYGRNMNRRLAAWTKGLTAEALHSASERRSSALVHVNAAYTSQADPGDHCTLGVRRGTGFTAKAGLCGKQTWPLRLTSCTDMVIPASPCSPRTRGSSRSCRNGPIANGPDCRPRTPAPKTGAESETSRFAQV
jgi:hypothetical protein